MGNLLHACVGKSHEITKHQFDKQFEGFILDADTVEQGYELGQGEYGAVVKGIWFNGTKKVDVAIKTLNEEYMMTGRDVFLNEAEIMVKLDHPCIVKLIGVSEGPPLMLLQELMTLGSLLDFLLDYPEKININPDHYLWAAQIACGMLYLETQHFIHRDLAARNILLQDKKQVKVGDFGLSRAAGTGDIYQASKGGRWPVRWYAPESINFGNFSHASDVWSFGITLWEMFSFGDQPYEDKTGADVIAFIERGGRLERPDKCPQNVYNLMQKCWKYEVKDRITFRQLLDEFNDMNDKKDTIEVPEMLYMGSNC